jgi:Carboxypeptidase regulatory-like domain
MTMRSSLAVLLVVLAAAGLGLAGCGGSGDGGGGGGGGEAIVTGTAVDDGTLARLEGAVAQSGSARSAPTGADGVFRISGLSTGTRQIEVSASGYAAASVTVTLRSGTNNVGFVYVPPALRSGRGAITGIMVRSGTYEPVSGGTIQVGDATARSRSDGSGKFTIYNVPAGNVQVSFLDTQSGSNAWRYVDVRDGQITNVGTVVLSIGPPPPPPI